MNNKIGSKINILHFVSGESAGFYLGGTPAWLSLEPASSEFVFPGKCGFRIEPQAQGTNYSQVPSEGRAWKTKIPPDSLPEL